jgi:outer membrane immunogenic protein
MFHGNTYLLSGALALAISGAAAPARAADLGGQGKAQWGGLKDNGGGYVERAPGLWQGLYLGATLGATGSAADIRNFGKKDDAELDGSSVSIAPVIGYNFSNGPWVWGVEADINGAGFDEKKSITGLGTLSASADWYGSLRLRGGYAWDRLLIYGTAGVAFGDFEIKSSLGGKDSSVQTGLALGVGAEYAIDDKWTARAEALAYTFSDNVTLAGKKQDVDFGHGTVRLGLTRKF